MPCTVSFLLDVRISILSLKAITDSSLEPKPLASSETQTAQSFSIQFMMVRFEVFGTQNTSAALKLEGGQLLVTST
jgi:hypothetical protein